jgi:hypothetical protein
MLLAIADDSGDHFGHHCHWRASPISIKHRGQHKYINIYFNVMNLLKPFEGGLEKGMCNAAHPLAWIHQVLAAGGVGGSSTMVVVFVVCLCCVLRSCLVVVTHCM